MTEYLPEVLKRNESDRNLSAKMFSFRNKIEWQQLKGENTREIQTILAMIHEQKE